jgi:hypothetical protein
MLVMLQAPVTGGTPDRLTVGVAARLSRYLQVLTQAKKMGKERISSQEIADYTNINATQIRRDLSNFGKFGKRGVGYSIESLLAEIRKILRTQGQHNIALVGAGRLGQAIASSPIFAEHGINIAAVFDSSPAPAQAMPSSIPTNPPPATTSSASSAISGGWVCRRALSSALLPRDPCRLALCYASLMYTALRSGRGRPGAVLGSANR